MTLTDLLYCIVQCIFDNQGNGGGAEPVDAVARRAYDLKPLTKADRERLLNTMIGHFYSNDGENFGKVRDTLWDSIAENIRGDGSTLPEWFTPNTSISKLVAFAA